MRWLCRPIVAILTVISGVLLLNAGEMNPVQYWGNDADATYVVATTREIDSHYLAVAAPEAAWIDLKGKPAPGGAVKVDAAVVEPWLHFSPAEFRRDLSQAELEAVLKKREKALLAACKKAGLVLPKEGISSIHLFVAGSAKIKVDRVLRGRVNQGDELTLTWNRLHQKSCPPFTPYSEGQFLYLLIFEEDGRTLKHFDGAVVTYLPELEAKLGR